MHVRRGHVLPPNSRSVLKSSPSSCKALDEPANSRIKRELGETLKALRALPKHQLGGLNGNGSDAHEGPAPLLARCRELAMQVEVRRSRPPTGA